MNSSNVMDISFDLLTTTNFGISVMGLSDLDLATIIPSNEMQHVSLSLHESGDMEIVIKELDFKQKVTLPTHIPQGDYPKVSKTTIKNGKISLFDKNDKLISSESIPSVNRIDIVEKINSLGDKFTQSEMNSTIASMQGAQFVDNLEKFIDEAPQNGIQITQQDEKLMTLRMPVSKIEPRDTSGNTVVLLINKLDNKMVGSRVYDSSNKPIQTTYLNYGNDNGSIKSIRNIVKFILPSGKETKMIVTSKIDNLKFSLNIK